MNDVWKVTDENRNRIVAFQKSLKLSFDDIKDMLEEDDFPVDIFHKEIGIGKVFHSTHHLDEFIRELDKQL